MQKYDFGKNTTHLETHPATIAGVKGEIVVLLHDTSEGFIHEIVFCGKIASEDVFIGEAFAYKPSKDQIEAFKTRGKVREHIERQKQLREGWH